MKKNKIIVLLLFTALSNAQDIKLNGSVSAESNQIKNVADPTDAQDAVTKSYVDSNTNSFSGSYSDLTNKPDVYTKAQTYSQSEVDALIADLQSQIDQLEQSSTESEYKTFVNVKWALNNAGHTTYRDGTEIPQVSIDSEWSNLTTGAWCYVDNDSNKGKLYNWYAIVGIHDESSSNDPSQRKEFAPAGHLVPTRDNLDDLISGISEFQPTTTSVSVKIASQNGWAGSGVSNTPGYNVSNNNSSEFNVTPQGIRHQYGNFYGYTERAALASKTEGGSGNFYCTTVYNNNISVTASEPLDKGAGVSVRLIKVD